MATIGVLLRKADAAATKPKRVAMDQRPGFSAGVPFPVLPRRAPNRGWRPPVFSTARATTYRAATVKGAGFENPERAWAGDTTPSGLVARNEASAAVLSSLARLPEDQREAIRLRFLEDMPVGDVARCLGKTDAAIHGLCRRGLRGLREFLVSMSRYLTKS